MEFDGPRISWTVVEFIDVGLSCSRSENSVLCVQFEFVCHGTDSWRPKGKLGSWTQWKSIISKALGRGLDRKVSIGLSSSWRKEPRSSALSGSMQVLSLYRVRIFGLEPYSRLQLLQKKKPIQAPICSPVSELEHFAMRMTVPLPI